MLLYFFDSGSLLRVLLNHLGEEVEEFRTRVNISRLHYSCRIPHQSAIGEVIGRLEGTHREGQNEHGDSAGKDIGRDAIKVRTWG